MTSWIRYAFITAVLLSTGAAGVLLRPSISTVAPDARLEEIVPAQIGEWHVVPTAGVQVSVLNQGETSTDQPYDEVLSRSYVNTKGDVVMLALAYGKNQRQEIKIHRPDLCYPAQGFKLISSVNTTFTGIATATSGAPIQGRRLLVRNDRSDEVVSYWIRIGDSYSSNPWDIRWGIMKEGLQGRMTDGILVRASQRLPMGVDPAVHHELVEGFMKDLLASLSPQAKLVLAR
jgi:EpsI family protein